MNYTNIAANMNLSSFSDMLKLANTTTGDSFWTGVYWMIMVVILLTSMAFGFEIAMVLTFFGGLIMGIFLLYLGLMNWTIFAATEAILLGLVFYFIYTSNKQQ